MNQNKKENNYFGCFLTVLVIFSGLILLCCVQTELFWLITGNNRGSSKVLLQILGLLSIVGLILYFIYRPKK
jgi:hypothetical protein